MVEPAPICGLGVALAGQPEPAAFRAVHAVVLARIVAVLGAPVGFACPAGFVADPAGFAANAPKHAVGANLMHAVAEVGHVVVSGAVHVDRRVAAAIVARAAVSTVEPHLELVGAILRQLGALLQKDVFYIFIRSVVYAVAVPGRDVEAVFHAKFLCCSGEIAGNVGVASEVVAGGCHVVRRSFRGPEAEAVVVLHHGDTALHASIFGGLEPLLRVGRGCGGKARFGFVAVAPFEAGVSVHAVVEEGIKFGFLPLQLARMGHGLYGHRLIVGIRQRFRYQRKLRHAAHRQQSPHKE